jgi:membrane-associated phospholipid phosphatase
MLISDNQYLSWQKKLSDNKFFRCFWVFCGIYSVLLIFAAGIYLLALGKWRQVVLALIALVLARLILLPLIQIYYKKKRPYQALHFTTMHSWLFSEPNIRPQSFPSSHAASFAAITTVFMAYFPILGLLLILVSFANGWARIILGYHYLIDILCGWLLGIISGLIVVYWLSPLLFTR